MDTTPIAAAPRASRTSTWVTAGVAIALLAVGLTFALKTTDAPTHAFAIFKLIHVGVAVFWVGGGLLLTVLALRAERTQDPEEMATIARQAVFAGEKLFAPAGLVVLAMGITMVINSPEIGFGTTWVVVGLVGYALSFTTGIGVLAPMSRRIVTLLEEKGAAAPETQAAIARILLIARIDIAVLLLVVADMLMKPFS
ncbi:MAG TPA: DUF2269 family protein [Gaiellaceae bacterium]|nr:DUF2269 family protein [Gaiellaceae bacterium]